MLAPSRRERVMQPAEFAACHGPALEADEVRHNLILGLLGRLTGASAYWTLGAAGCCALQTEAERPIVIGELDQAQCHALADLTADHAFAGVVGPDLTARWFADRAASRGIAFAEAIPQQIHALADKPRYPGVPGRARM